MLDTSRFSWTQWFPDSKLLLFHRVMYILVMSTHQRIRCCCQNKKISQRKKLADQEACYILPTDFYYRNLVVTTLIIPMSACYYLELHNAVTCYSGVQFLLTEVQYEQKWLCLANNTFSLNTYSTAYLQIVTRTNWDNQCSQNSWYLGVA